MSGGYLSGGYLSGGICPRIYEHPSQDISHFILHCAATDFCFACSLATLCLSTTSDPVPGEFPGFWSSMVFHHAPIPWKGSGNNNRKICFAFFTSHYQIFYFILCMLLCLQIKTILTRPDIFTYRYFFECDSRNKKAKRSVFCRQTE